MTRFTIVVAMTWPGRLIGRDGRLPWGFPEDMKHFVRVTKGRRPMLYDRAVIMGRKTYQSLPSPSRPLPNRMNYVISATMDKIEENTDVPFGNLKICRDPGEARDLTDEEAGGEAGEVFIIGGASIYEAFLREGWVDRMIITEVPSRMVYGDTYFPPFLTTDLWPRWKTKTPEPGYDVAIDYVPGVWNLEESEFGPGVLVVHEFTRVAFSEESGK